MVMTAEFETLDQAIANEREELGLLRKRGLNREAEMIEASIARIARAAEPFVDWLSEGEAQLMSGHRADWLRKNFASWAARGLARWNPLKTDERQYLRCVLPQRANRSAAREAGRRGERVTG
jgi:hypothetical protein